MLLILLTMSVRRNTGRVTDRFAGNGFGFTRAADASGVVVNWTQPKLAGGITTPGAPGWLSTTEHHVADRADAKAQRLQHAQFGRATVPVWQTSQIRRSTPWPRRRWFLRVLSVAG